MMRDGDYENTIPALPTAYDASVRKKHRHTIPANQINGKLHVADNIMPFPALVARPVHSNEIEQQPLAREARDKEWSRLRGHGEKGCWDESQILEWDGICKDAQKSRDEVHLAHLMGLMVEKGSELAKDDPNGKYRYGVVLRGDQTKNQNYEAAMFQDIGSAPATVAAAKMADAYGCLLGHSLEQADAIQAYVQSELKGPETWVCIPPEARTPAMKGMKKPCCKLLRSLYGHPSAGGLLGGAL